MFTDPDVGDLELTGLGQFPQELAFAKLPLMSEREISKNSLGLHPLALVLLPTLAAALLEGCGGDAKPRTYSEVAFKPVAQTTTGMGMGNLPPTNTS
ncbi:MAG TPA: hypothetical protein VK465_08790, partial [Fibrobacteria bacterium]|nr:hypothetical protein [Fibrobacteria bacterium]